MKKFYFTFGADREFPYQNVFLIILADSKREAIEKFCEKYPDRYENVYNCSFVYSEEQWKNGVDKYYPSEPAEVID